jgi:hypothetical protein
MRKVDCVRHKEGGGLGIAVGDGRVFVGCDDWRSSMYKAGNYIRWTIFARVDISSRPCWARIVRLSGRREGRQFGVVHVLAAGDVPIEKLPREFETCLDGWPPSSAVCEIFTEEEVPAKAWAQIVQEQLTEGVD